MPAAGRTWRIRLAAAALLGTLAVSCGGREPLAVSCPAETYLEDGRCAPICEACGPGTTCVEGRCVRNPGPVCAAGTVLRGNRCEASPLRANGGRFTSLTLTEPASISGLITTIAGPAIASGEVLVLYKPREVRFGPPAIRVMEFGGGIALPGVSAHDPIRYQLDPRSTACAQAYLAEDGRFETEPFVLKLPLVSHPEGDDYLWLDRAVVACTLGVAGLIAPGATCTLRGGIRMQTAESIYLDVVSSTLFDLLGGRDTVDIDLDNDGIMDGWQLEGTFAVEYAVVEDAAPAVRR